MIGMDASYVSSCSLCSAMLMPSDVAEHYQWHVELEHRVQMLMDRVEKVARDLGWEVMSRE